MNWFTDRKIIFGLLFFLLIQLTYTFLVMFNYDFAWINSEKLHTHLSFLQNGSKWQPEDWLKGLDTTLIEIDANRISRPLSNILEVINAKWRASLWDHIPPHPSLSLLWPFMFILLPICLYRFFRNMQCATPIALAGTMLYLSATGFLAPLVMLFHPAKNLVNLFAVLSLFSLSIFCQKEYDHVDSLKKIPNYISILTLWFVFTYLAFFGDETGLFLFVIIVVLMLPQLWRFKERWFLVSLLTLLPICYWLTIHYFLPALHQTVTSKSVGLTGYRDFPSIKELFWPNWQNLFTNGYLLLSDHPGLKWFLKPMSNHPIVLTIQIIYTFAFLGALAWLVQSLRQHALLKLRLTQIIAGLALLTMYIFFHTFQLSHNVKLWCLWWYGSLFSLIFYITLTISLQTMWESRNQIIFKKVFLFLIAILLTHGLMSATYRIAMFKKQNLNPSDYPHPAILAGKITPYELFNLSENLDRSNCRYGYTVLVWASAKNKNVNMKSIVPNEAHCRAVTEQDRYFKAEAFYLPIELGTLDPQYRKFLLR